MNHSSGYNAAMSKWPDPPVSDFDNEHDMVPPWVKYPNLPPLGSLAWRMGAGEAYLIAFEKWWKDRSDADRLAWKSKYAIPENWLRYWLFSSSVSD
jgi:hypothetical protein